MIKSFITIVSIFICFSLNGSEPKIEKLQWLKGNWRGKVGKNRFQAIYTSWDGGCILSVNKEFLPDGRLSHFEFEKFHKKDENICMTPYINGKEASTFTMVEFDRDSNSATFENSENQFPSRIRYQLKDKNLLLISLMGTQEDKQVAITYRLHRTQDL